MTAHRYAGGLKKFDLWSGPQRHRHFGSDVKPKLKIPMGTAVFAQNFPGWSDKTEYEGILYVLTPLDVSRDSIYRTVQKSFRHFSTDSKLT